MTGLGLTSSQPGTPLPLRLLLQNLKSLFSGMSMSYIKDDVALGHSSGSSTSPHGFWLLLSEACNHGEDDLENERDTRRKLVLLPLHVRKPWHFGQYIREWLPGNVVEVSIFETTRL